MYAFQCGNDSKKKLGGFCKSQSKQIMFEEYYNFLFDGENQNDCVYYLVRSLYDEMQLQRVKISTLSLFDDKRLYINQTESKPWN